MKTLNVIGAGRVGTTLAALWQSRQVFAIQDVLDGKPAGARDAVLLIGAGTPAADLAAMRAADVWMLTTPDRRIAQACQDLAASGLLRRGDVVFHCSGSASSAELSTAAACGAGVASVHPLKSFANASDAVRSFAGTFCAAEGSAEALAVLRPAFESIGARLSELDPRFKTIYHAASVMVSNYLTALLEVGLRCYSKAALPRTTALAMMEPIVRDTVENVFRLGPAHALTGPIARGDDAVVAGHLEALSTWDVEVTAVYRALGMTAVDLAREHGEAEGEALARIEALLNR